MTSRGGVINNDNIIRGQQIIHYLSTRKDHTLEFTYNHGFYKVLNAKVNVDKVDESKGIHRVISVSLSKMWLISPEAARRIFQNKTQRGIRTIMHPSLPRRFKTNA